RSMICSSFLYSFQMQRFSISRRTASGSDATTGMRSSERATGQVAPRRRRGASAGSAMFPSLGAVEHDPSAEIGADRFETMLRPGRREQRITRAERNSLAAAEERAVAARDDVDLVLLMRRLRIAAPWRVVAQHHGSVAHQLGRAKARRNRR